MAMPVAVAVQASSAKGYVGFASAVAQLRMQPARDLMRASGRASQRRWPDNGLTSPGCFLVNLIAAFLPHTWQVAAHLPPKFDAVIRPDEVDP